MRRHEYVDWVVALPLCLLSSVTGGRRNNAAWHLKIGAFIYVVGKPFAGLVLEYSDILFLRNVDPLQCRVCYIVGMGKRVANALVLRRDVFDIASHECLLVLCAQRSEPCLEAEAGEKLGWELLSYFFSWSVGREYDGIAVEVVHHALRVGEMPALKQVEEEVPNRRVGLLELVYEDDPGFACLDFQGELALFAADVAAWASDERIEGVFAAVVAEVDLREGLARCEQVAEDAGRLGLADAGCGATFETGRRQAIEL